MRHPNFSDDNTDRQAPARKNSSGGLAHGDACKRAAAGDPDSTASFARANSDQDCATWLSERLTACYND